MELELVTEHSEFSGPRVTIFVYDAQGEVAHTRELDICEAGLIPLPDDALVRMKVVLPLTLPVVEK